MQKEKLQRKKKTLNTKNKENQNPNFNKINEIQLGDKDSDILKIKMEEHNKSFKESNFVNSQKNLNLNSKESITNFNDKSLEIGFEGIRYKA